MTGHDGGASEEGRRPIVLLGRYAVEDRLAVGNSYQSFAATDRSLNRAVAVAAAKKGNALLATSRALAGIRSPHVVHPFDSGHDNGVDFVVFERPSQTVAELSESGDPRVWNGARAVAVTEEVLVALGELEAAGITTDVLHLGSIGLDHAGHVRLSPWALTAVAPADGGVKSDEAVADGLELPLAVLASAHTALPQALIDVIARLRDSRGVGGITTRDQLVDALANIERNDALAMTGTLPTTPGLTTMTPAVAATAAAASAPLTAMHAPIRPAFSHPGGNPQRAAVRRHHLPSPLVLVCSGVAAAVLALSVLLFLGSPSPNVSGQGDNDSSHAKTAGNSAGAATPRHTSAQQTTTSTSGPAPTTTTTAPPATTTTTTPPLATTTTTVPATTTTTTAPPTTTTTTTAGAAAPAASG